jgi:hypothetical protein
MRKERQKGSRKEKKEKKDENDEKSIGEGKKKLGSAAHWSRAIHDLLASSTSVQQNSFPEKKRGQKRKKKKPRQL